LFKLDSEPCASIIPEGSLRTVIDEMTTVQRESRSCKSNLITLLPLSHLKSVSVKVGDLVVAGVIICEGLEEDANEFVHRLRQLRWKVLLLAVTALRCCTSPFI